MKTPRATLVAADAAALATVCVWGLNFVFVKAAFEQFDVGAFVALRYLLMLALGWAVVGLRRRGLAEVRQVAGAGWGKLVPAALLGFAVYIPLSMVGLAYTTAFSNALLIAVSPLCMAVILWLSGAERIGRPHVVGLALAVAGIAVFISQAVGAGAAGMGLGDLISLAAAVAYAGYNVANRTLVTRFPATVVTTLTLTVGAIPVVLATLPGLLHQDWQRVHASGAAALAFSAVFPIYVAWSVWGWVNARAGVARSSLFLYLVPVVGGAAAALQLHERFSAPKLAGAALVLAGLAAVRLLSRRRDDLPAAPVARAVTGGARTG